MKRFVTFAFVIALFLAMFTMPALAQDTIPSDAATNTLSYVIVVVLAVLLVGAMIFGAYVTGWLAKLVPPETAASIYQSGVRFGFQVALDKAAKTASPLDDEFLTELARTRGMVVEKITAPDGTVQYVVKSAVTPSPSLPTSGAATVYPDAG